MTFVRVVFRKQLGKKGPVMWRERFGDAHPLGMRIGMGIVFYHADPWVISPKIFTKLTIIGI